MSPLFGSLATLFWMRPVTADLNTTLGWALITFAPVSYTHLDWMCGGAVEPVEQMTTLFCQIRRLKA